MATWITDWSDIGDDTAYLVQPVNARPGGTLYLGAPPQVIRGWQVKRLTRGCYAALEVPDPEPALRRLVEERRRAIGQ